MIKLAVPMSENFKCPGSTSANWELSLNWPQTPRVIVCVEVQSVATPSKIRSIARPLKYKQTIISRQRLKTRTKIFTCKMHRLVCSINYRRLPQFWVTLVVYQHWLPKTVPSTLCFSWANKIKKSYLNLSVNHRELAKSLFVIH